MTTSAVRSASTPCTPPPQDYKWCNPDGRRVGEAPGLVGAGNGVDFRVWIKAPGTSDGDCGNGRGSYGGQFLPDVAYRMVVG